MTPQYLLKDLTVEITRKCPMRCVLCSSEGGDIDPAELSLADLCKIVDDAKQLGVTTISLSGGEPLESPYLFEFIRYVKKSGIILHLYTCGNISFKNQINAISEETFQQLQELSVDKIIFSIHGPNAEIHEKITTKQGSFENLITSIKRAQQYKHSIELHFVPVLSNFEYLPQTCAVAKELGIHQLSILRFVPQGRGAKNRDVLEINGNDVIKLEKILKGISGNLSFRLRFGSPFNCFNMDNRTKCTAGIDKASIRPDGIVFPCVSLKKIILENGEDNDIHKMSLEEIWVNSRIFNLIRSFHNSIKESNCRNCDHFSFCGGGCLTQRIIDSDDIPSSRDPYCYIERFQKRMNNKERVIRTNEGVIHGP